jgi:hypothetical protein
VSDSLSMNRLWSSCSWLEREAVQGVWLAVKED